MISLTHSSNSTNCLIQNIYTQFCGNQMQHQHCHLFQIQYRKFDFIIILWIIQQFHKFYKEFNLFHNQQNKMLSSLLKNSNQSLHRKSQSLLPTLSLSQLQKNYYELRQRKQHREKASKGIRQRQSIEKQMVIRSPFYERNNCSNKSNCKCEFHKKIKSQVQIKFSYRKRLNFQLKNSMTRLQTLQDQSIQNKKTGHKRFNSLGNQIEGLRTKSMNFYQNLIVNNQDLYQQFLKKLQLEQKFNVDCYNHQFEQFLKSHGKWILHDIKQKNFLQKNLNLQNASTKSRFRTSPSIPIDFQNELYFNNDQKDKYLKLRVEDLKKNIRKKHKKNTDYSFESDKSYRSAKSGRFMSCILNLKTQERDQLEGFLSNACKEIGLNFSELKTKNCQNVNFFSTLCKNLIDSDQSIVQKAKAVLKRISRLPLDLYSALLKQMKLEVKQFEPKSQMIQKSLCMVFDTIEDSLSSMIKTKEQLKGRQKLSILSKLKSKYVGRGSLNYYSGTQSKNKLRFSKQQSNWSKQKEDSKRSRFAIEKKSFRASEQQQIQNDIETDKSNNDLSETQISNILNPKQSGQSYGQIVKSRQLKKGINLKKLKKNHIMKIIDEQIEFDQKKLFLPKKINSHVEEEYLKQRNQSRKRLRNQQQKKHLEFLSLMRQKQNQRQSSTLSQYEMKKNNTRAHYQRHKIFLKKMEVSLQNNEQLKQMIINYEDDLFTKKRKVRILKTLIHQQKSIENAQFCKDIRKYIDIFEKNCNMVVGKDNWGHFKKYATRKDDKLFESQYLQIEDSQISLQMQNLFQVLKADYSLKFYDIKLVCLEEQNYFSLVKELPSFTSQRINNSIGSKNIHISENRLTQVGPKYQSESLIQTGLENKITQLETKICQNLNNSEQSRLIQIQQIQSKNLRRIREKFDKNMEKFQKIFKCQTSFNQS